MLHDVAKDEFAFASGVARVDKSRDVLALDEPQEKIEPVLAFLERV